MSASVICRISKLCSEHGRSASFLDSLLQLHRVEANKIKGARHEKKQTSRNFRLIRSVSNALNGFARKNCDKNVIKLSCFGYRLPIDWITKKATKNEKAPKEQGDVNEAEPTQKKKAPAAKQASKKPVKKSEVEDEVDSTTGIENGTATKKPAAKATKKAPAKSSKKVDKDVEDDEPIEEEAATVKKATGPKSRKKKIEEPEQSDEEKVVVPKRAARPKKVPEASNAKEKETGAKKGRKPKEVVEDDESGEEAAPEPRLGTRARRAKDVAEVGESSEEEAEAPAKKTQKRKAPKAQKEPEKKAKASNATATDWDEISFECTSKTPAGKAPNYHITSWNVDGIRAWLKKGGLEILKYAQPDILCLQETKCSDEKLPEELNNAEGYKAYWCSSEKDGYAGVGVLTKTEPLNVSYGINSEEHDDEGRCITAEYDKFYLVNVYVPNAGRKLVTLPKRLEWNEAFKAFIQELDSKKPVIICGDMNVAHTEIDLANPKTNTKNAGFTEEEREGMTDFLGDGYIDTFRKLYPDKEKAYTFWSYMANSRSKNVGWRLDYFIISQRFMEHVCDNIIHDKVLGSDHCPVSLHVNL